MGTVYSPQGVSDTPWKTFFRGFEDVRCKEPAPSSPRTWAGTILKPDGIEMVFSEYDVRYIAINDQVDTVLEENNDMMPFRNLFNGTPGTPA